MITLPAQPQGTVSDSFLSLYRRIHMRLYSVFLWFFLSYTGAFTCACILFFYGSYTGAFTCACILFFYGSYTGAFTCACILFFYGSFFFLLSFFCQPYNLMYLRAALIDFNEIWSQWSMTQPAYVIWPLTGSKVIQGHGVKKVIFTKNASSP